MNFMSGTCLAYHRCPGVNLKSRESGFCSVSSINYTATGPALTLAEQHCLVRSKSFITRNKALTLISRSLNNI